MMKKAAPLGHAFINSLAGFGPWLCPPRDQARKYCRAQGGDLVSINNAAEQDFINQQLLSQDPVAAQVCGAQLLDCGYG